jgi:TRAP transporter TAXI family solute receptor
MLRQLLCLSLTTLIAISFAGCEQPKTGDAASTGAREFISLGTATGGGAFVPVGNAIANTVQAKKGDLNWVVGAKGTKGTQENIRKLESGDLQFAMANAAISYFAHQGEGAWGKPFDVRAVATIAPNVGIFVTTKSTGIKTIADLKGKRVVLGPAGAGFDYFLKPLLAAHGVSYEDLTALNGTYLDASNMISDGQADAAFMGGAIPIPVVSQLCSSQDVVFVQSESGVAEKLKQYPFYFPVTVKAEKYSDLETDLEAINVGNMQLLSHANVSEDIVYEFTKRVYENRAKIAEQHPAGKALNPKNIVRDTGTPFHPGAIKFYKEAGIWPEM